MTGIILLNWNGAADTIACLESLEKAKGEFFVVVADNASSDDSLTLLSQWIVLHTTFPTYLLPLDDNYGFAVGNNKALQYARQYAPDSYLLLNNDTEVTPDFLTQLHSFADAHPSCLVLTSLIAYYGDKQKVWLCGGTLSFGSRRRGYFDAPVSSVPDVESIPTTFVSGCCLFFRPQLLDNQGCLLSDRFFFGEEDYEFSLRMQQAGVCMACIPRSVIYHKVSASKNRLEDNHNTGKDYSFYLGKLIGCRLHYSAPKYNLLLGMMFFKSLLNFHAKGNPWSRSLALASRLLSDGRKKEKISNADFQYYLNQL